MNLAESIPKEALGLRGVLQNSESMRRHTSWRVGGPVDQCYTPADLADLSVFLRNLPAGEPITFVGLGSNLLVRDGGIRGTVVFTHAALAGLELVEREGRKEIFVETGVASPKVSRFAATHDYEGGEFLTGIPGTIGGALAMNAGCYGSETWDIVTQVLTIDRVGQLRERRHDDYSIAYRSVVPKFEGDEFFVGAWLYLQPGDGERSRRKIKSLLHKRIASQPLQIPNAGSVFRNPPGDYAARLIEKCGLKGVRCGTAMVSTKHANFIVNSGDASAADIESLIDHVHATVLEKCGIDLHREVRIIGEVAR